jgi:hypothetical protein
MAMDGFTQQSALPLRRWVCTPSRHIFVGDGNTY